MRLNIATSMMSTVTLSPSWIVSPDRCATASQPVVIELEPLLPHVLEAQQHVHEQRVERDERAPDPTSAVTVPREALADLVLHEDRSIEVCDLALDLHRLALGVRCHERRFGEEADGRAVLVDA